MTEVEAALLTPAFRLVIDCCGDSAMSSASPITVFIDRTKPTANAPALLPPWFFAVFESENVPPAETDVAVVDNAVMARSGGGTLIVVLVQAVLFASLDSTMVLALSALAQR